MARPRRATGNETPEQTERRRASYRRWQNNAKARQLAAKNADDYKPPLTLKNSTEKRYTNCDICRFLAYCSEVVWDGLVLPCQPQSEETILNMREPGDYVNDWHPGSEKVLLPRSNKHHNTQVEG